MKHGKRKVPIVVSTLPREAMTAEICELVGIFILKSLEDEIDK